MKKTIFVLGFAFLGLISPVKAEDERKPIELDLKIIKLVLPFQDLYAQYLFDFIQKENMGGLETPFAQSGRVNFTIGAADAESSEEAIPYLGFDVQVSNKYLGENFSVGGWIAYDFKEEKRRGGLKASIKLW